MRHGNGRKQSSFRFICLFFSLISRVILVGFFFLYVVLCVCLFVCVCARSVLQVPVKRYEREGLGATASHTFNVMVNAFFSFHRTVSFFRFAFPEKFIPFPTEGKNGGYFYCTSLLFLLRGSCNLEEHDTKKIIHLAKNGSCTSAFPRVCGCSKK